VPPATAKFGVISDLDDTVIVTNVTNRLKMFLTVALLNEHTRLPFKAWRLFTGRSKTARRARKTIRFFTFRAAPGIYIRRSTEFLRIHKIPLGALVSEGFRQPNRFAPGDHESHKLNSIETILDTYPHLPFVFNRRQRRAATRKFTASPSGNPESASAPFTFAALTRKTSARRD
jgi:phosphatidate phosphatase APP1